ncbi:alpha-amylase family glycosyl hydrolase [Persicobacter diffluens]|uniref:Glycosyl hydrolase family 13 catalytic domain-containing protein n=1 Tax=Persicobacter diffluens TaxID=981 RepID=A0AAN4W023_9BACT|nr:hypothetical protein PEDI_37530 [Persicobacter diffluens]
MKKLFYGLGLLSVLSLSACSEEQKQETADSKVSQSIETPFFWENANVYFLLTDRFQNGDKSNDLNFERTKETGPLRGFMGGDIKGITQKIEEGYFTDLGINAIWFTPVVEQVHGSVDEGTGETYAYHGYWAKDWTALDPNFGTMTELEELIEKAHAKGIRVLLDVVINHTGPVTEQDPVYPSDWVRIKPKCAYNSYETYVDCTLVENLPDVLTNSDQEVALPPHLVEKWKKEGRLDEEVASLNAFFERTGLPRAPRFYIMKWLSDYVRKYGVDGFRVDTVKHTEAGIWEELRKVVVEAFADWKKEHPAKKLDDNDFYMVGEVYNYVISSGRDFSYDGDTTVNFFDNGFKSLINFEFKYDAQKPYEELFAKYDAQLSGVLSDKSVMNYLTSHDDGAPFDPDRSRAMEAATKLLLTPGATQIYYGDETIRPLVYEGAVGDANLRTFMNWEELSENVERGGHKAQDVFNHYARLGKFRIAHPAVGAGRHQMISESPYVFSRKLDKDGFQDQVVVALDLTEDQKEISVSDVFQEGDKVMDYYSGQTATVKDGKVAIKAKNGILLIGK